MRLRGAWTTAILCAASMLLPSRGQTPNGAAGNAADRLTWFQDQGFGIFVHWSVDSQLGVVISHSLVDASADYTQRFFGELPRSFNPKRFDADELASLAKLSGAKYLVFTTKHHSGFTMFPSKTTDFGIMSTPFHRDITGEILAATRREGLATGVYFSPDDFHWLWEHHIAIAREVPSVTFAANPGLLRYDQQQIRELLGNYGPVDMLFLDGEAGGLRELAWQMQPRIVVTRGAIQTPEQRLPDEPLPGPWEACITMASAWQYQPQHETYKSGPELIRLLVQTRARGGNLLLNVGPDPDGELPTEAKERLREIGLWMFVNSEAIYSVRPWAVAREGDVWFTRGAVDPQTGESTLYAMVDRPWKRGEWLELTLHSVLAGPESRVSVLGQNSQVLEYSPKVNPTPTMQQQSDGLHLRVMRTQRLQDAGEWPNMAVIRITHAKPLNGASSAIVPPVAGSKH